MSGHTHIHTRQLLYITLAVRMRTEAQFWGLHTEERKQCYEYIIHDNYSVGLDKNTNDFMQ